MTRPFLAALFFVIAFVMAGFVAAQEAPPPAAPVPPVPSQPPGSDDARYSFHRAGDDLVRLDGRTGQVSACRRETAGWTCRAVPDERAALEEAIGRLQSDNAALKKELLVRNLALPPGIKADPPAVAPAEKPTPPETVPPSAKAPSDAEFDRVMAFFERVWRRLVEMMADFQRDMQRKG
jgi:hypothetical protein